MNFKKFTNFYIIRLSKGEEIQEEIKKFCQTRAKNGGYFWGLGAVEKAVLAHYDVGAKKYSQKEIKKPLEMTSLVGNVCFFEKEIIVHSHAVFADKDLKTFSGHLVEAKISGTAEVIFFPFNQKIKKFFDEETGLKLMKI